MPFKICVIGCGDMATLGHGPAFQKYAQLHPDVELTTCCDLDPSRAELFRSTFGFERACTDVEQMLFSEKPDAVSLIVPPAVTAPLAEKLLLAGVPVILEKPPGLDREQTLRLMEIADRTGTPNQVAFNRRYMPTVRRFLELRQGRKDLLWQYDFYRVDRRDKDFSTTSIHGIDTLRFLAGKPYRQVSFHYTPNPQDSAFVPNIVLNCEFSDGAMGRITFSPASGRNAERCIMQSTNQMIYASLPCPGMPGSVNGAGTILVAENNQITLRENAWEEEFFISNGFYDENAHFFDCIRSGVRPQDDIASGLQAVEIADCIRKGASSYTASL